jgi:hypothetical protein
LGSQTRAGGRDAACPFSTRGRTGGGTRRVHLVRGAGGRGTQGARLRLEQLIGVDRRRPDPRVRQHDLRTRGPRAVGARGRADPRPRAPGGSLFFVRTGRPGAGRAPLPRKAQGPAQGFSCCQQQRECTAGTRVGATAGKGGGGGAHPTHGHVGAAKVGEPVCVGLQERAVRASAPRAPPPDSPPRAAPPRERRSGPYAYAWEGERLRTKNKDRGATGGRDLGAAHYEDDLPVRLIAQQNLRTKRWGHGAAHSRPIRQPDAGAPAPGTKGAAGHGAAHLCSLFRIHLIPARGPRDGPRPWGAGRGARGAGRAIELRAGGRARGRGYSRGHGRENSREGGRARTQPGRAKPPLSHCACERRVQLVREEGTRRVQLVREGGGGGAPRTARRAGGPCGGRAGPRASGATPRESTAPSRPAAPPARYSRDRYSRDRYSRDRYSRGRYSRDRYGRGRYSRGRYSHALGPPATRGGRARPPGGTAGARGS